MKRDATDFHEVRTIHLAIHERLLNWARCVRPSTSGGQCAPMFRHYRSSEVWQQPTALVPIDTLDGNKMEKAVGGLPDKHREAVRWHYVNARVPLGKMCRLLAVRPEALAELVHDGRSMLKNRAAQK